MIMTLTEFMKQHNLTSIESIYRGLDHHCRCGCGGTYYHEGPFTRQINTINKYELIPDNEEEQDYYDKGGSIWLNLPYNDDRDLCYCVYFKRELISVR